MIRLFFLLASIIPIFCSAQSKSSLQLIPDSIIAIKSWNVVSLELPKNKIRELHESKGKKVSFNVQHMRINGDSLTAKRFRIRGQTSSYFRRKSFNISLNRKAQFHSPTDTFNVKKFYSISLNMDKNYIRNKLAYAVLEHQDILVPLNCYSNFIINGESEGIYLIVYPPAEYALKERNASLVIRRGYHESIDKLYTENLDRDAEKEIKKKFTSIYKRSIANSKGEQLYKQLSKVLNLENYFTWLAFNHLFQNGDYADEVYFFWNSEISQFDIIPWDMDDILENAPHEGFEKRGEMLNNKLIYSSEDKLDVAIANDPYLYKEYLKCYDKLLNTLRPEVLAEIFHHLFQEVYIYFQNQDVISQSQYDQYGLTNLGNLKIDLNNIYEIITNRAIVIDGQIKSELRR